MKKGSLEFEIALRKRGAPRENPAKWASVRYGGCETSWRTWINDPSKIRVDMLRKLKLSDEEILGIVR